jgi:hypothetical protein
MPICMPRALLIALVAHGLLAGAALAQGKISCAEAHKSLLQKLEQQSAGNLPPERLAAQKRRAQRIYDACITGDVHDPRGLFDRMDGGRY